MTSTALPDWLAHAAAATPERDALVADDGTWTCATLDAAASVAAHALARAGVREGDRVATLLHNGAVPVIAIHALLRLGATMVPLNVRLTAEELAWQVRDSAVRHLIADARTAPVAGAVADAVPGLHVIASRSLVTPATDAARHGGGPVRAHDPAHALAIVYTSGTSGRPKGAMLTVGNFWWSAVGSALNLGVHADDRWLACLPLFHVGGMSIALRSAIYGTAIVVHDGFDPEAVNRAIDADGITIVSVVAVMLQRMLDARGARSYPATLRCVLLGGGPAPQPLLERAATLGVPVVTTYGLTEAASQVATLAPGDALRRPGAAGRPLYPNAVRIVAADGSIAREGAAGEIQVRGPVVMAGYAGQPEATARTVADGWLRTGDIGHLDSDGFLYVLDRRDDLVVTGGENVYPAEVEAALLGHPWVAEAAVIGVPDPAWGHRVVGVVRLRDEVEEASAAPEVLRAHCRTHLAGYKIPSAIAIVADPLPRTASGKLRRATLREQFALTPDAASSRES